MREINNPLLFFNNLRISDIIKYINIQDKIKLLFLLFTNLLPIFGILFFNWDYKYLIFFYWAESIIVIFLFSIRFIIKMKNPTIVKRIVVSIFLIIILGIFLIFYLAILGMISGIILKGKGFIDFQLIYSIIKNQLLFLIALFVSCFISILIFNEDEAYEDGDFFFTISFVRWMIIFLAIWIAGALFSKSNISLISSICLIIFKAIFDFAILFFETVKNIEKRNPESGINLKITTIFVILFCLFFFGTLGLVLLFRLFQLIP